MPQFVAFSLEVQLTRGYESQMEIGSSVPSLNFRVWLQKEFTDRCRKNSKYSLRAFSQLLKMEASSVSQILSGKRGASNKVVTKICDHLSTSPDVRNRLLSGVQASDGSPAYHQVAVDAFAVIADWYHYAILELTFTKGFSSSPQWIGKKLGISPTEACVAIEGLERLELLEKKNGKLVKTDVFLTNYTEGLTAPALKELQRQLLKKALHAIDHVPQDQKDITSMTMATTPEKITEAKKRIRLFRRRLCAFLEDGPRTHIYNLGVQLYPISNSTASEENNNV